MQEAQIFYAPQYNYSVGGGHVEFDSDISSEQVRVTYARLNYLVHRWNLESAQANVFVWGGAGGATGGLIGMLIGTGIPEHRAKVYDTGVRGGGILLGIEAKTAEEADKLETLLEDIGAEYVRAE